MKHFKILNMFLVLLAVSIGGGDALAKKKKKKKKKRKKAKSGEMHKYPYGMAGCGLGTLVIKENTVGGQITASTLNATGYQLFAITTGTSNCEMQKADMALEEQRIYMEVNFASISKEAARGEGKHLRAFAEVLGCSDRYEDFRSLSQNQYNEIFSSEQPNAVLENYRSAVLNEKSLNGSCVRAQI